MNVDMFKIIQFVIIIAGIGGSFTLAQSKITDNEDKNTDQDREIALIKSQLENVIRLDERQIVIQRDVDRILKIIEKRGQ